MWFVPSLGIPGVVVGGWGCSKTSVVEVYQNGIVVDVGAGSVSFSTG